MTDGYQEDSRGPLCAMCLQREPSPQGRLYRGPGQALPTSMLPRLCMECTVDTRDAEIGF